MLTEAVQQSQTSFNFRKLPKSTSEKVLFILPLPDASCLGVTPDMYQVVGTTLLATMEVRTSGAMAVTLV